MYRASFGPRHGCTHVRFPFSLTSSTLADLGVRSPSYVGDGRFHLESVMIANPLIPAFRYDPYTKRFTRELYEHEEMRKMRGQAVEQARDSLRVTSAAGKEEAGGGKDYWAVVLGTLGRQGNLRVLRVNRVSRFASLPALR